MKKNSASPRYVKTAPTITDVARAAGVSTMTVSRVINSAGNVRAKTQAIVDAAISKLNYAPNPAARSLAGARQIRIGLLYSNPSAAYLTEFLLGVLDGTRLNHVQFVLEECAAGDDELRAAQILIDDGIDGVLLPPPLCDSAALLSVLEASGTPFVVVASGRPRGTVSAVGIDDFAAAHAMTTHLLKLGHTRIAFIAGSPDQTASLRRRQGYEAALQGSGQIPDPQLVAAGMFSYRSGLHAAELLLQLDDPPSAIFASNDDMAAATVAAAHSHGLAVPGDLTVCGFDDTTMATTIWPALTTVRQPIADMSRAALEMLVRKVKAHRAGLPQPADHRVLDFTLVRRQSDSAPQRRPTLRTGNA